MLWITLLSCITNSMEQSKETKLAYEIAEILDDMISIDWHIRKCNEYPESFLRKQLNTVLKSKKILTSRAAYYNYLVNLHGKHFRD